MWGFLRLPARDEGLNILSRVADHASGTGLAQRALLRIGEDRFEHREWTEAVEAYDRYASTFPQGDKVGEAMLKAAQAMLESFTGVRRDETPLIEADQRFREIARKFPITAAEAKVPETLEYIRALRAANLLEEGRFYQRVGKPSAATFTYRRVVDVYPQTPAADQAELALGILTSQPAGPAPTTAPGEMVGPPVRPVGPPPPPVSPPRPLAVLPVVTSQPAPEPVSLEPRDLENLRASSAPAGEHR